MCWYLKPESENLEEKLFLKFLPVYRQYLTWVEAGKWGCGGEADRTAQFGVAGLGERRLVAGTLQNMFNQEVTDTTARTFPMTYLHQGSLGLKRRGSSVTGVTGTW